MSALAVSHVYPLGSRLNERGRLEVGGCDVVELAARFGTPAYVYAEDDMRARARTFVEAFRARTERFEVIYAGKAFPCTAVFRLFAEEGLSADVASGGELHLALKAGMDPKRLYMHGNNKAPAELDYAIESGIGHIVVDSFDEIERLSGRSQRVLLRVTPGIEPSTHSFIRPARWTPSSASSSTRWTARSPSAPTPGSSSAACTLTSARRSSTWRCSAAWASCSAASATGRS